MQRMSIFLLIGVFFAVSASSPSPRALADESISYKNLVSRMIDLERLAALPAKGEQCVQWSSWDRKSQYDAKTEKYIAWDANGDGSGIIREENGVQVLAEMKGPGCIWRIWSALPKQGHVKIYLDGVTEPTVDLPFADYFDGKHAPFNYPMLSYRLEDLGNRGQNLYFPIPFQKSCKIVAEKGWGRYYHFTYRTFPKGTKVPTFSSALVKKNAKSLTKINNFLRDRLGTDPVRPREGQKSITNRARIAPGETATLQIEGPRAITAIRASVRHGNRADEMAALRKLALRITWDHQKKPAVWCPLGDFFGTAPGINLYKSLTTGMTPDSGYTYWYMPFGKHARIELVNEDSVLREVNFEIVHAPLSRPMNQLGYFHCKWHRDIFPLSKDRWPDWTVLRTQGRGRFCGLMLHVWNPHGGWWGEGDEKFFVDGEKFPSTFGTGSEDYFGYAWGDPHLFERPYHCQTMDENNQGHQSILRWHIVDNIPFQTSFEAILEKYFKNERGTLFACTACWYLDANGVDPLEPVPADQRIDYYVRPPLVAGGLQVLKQSGGHIQTQPMKGWADNQWKDNDQLWWTGNRPGNKLVLALPVKKTGRYELNFHLTKANDYAIVQLYLDDKKLGDPIDLYNTQVVSSGPIARGIHNLTAGQHRITVEITGANSQAKKSYLFGIDSVELKQVP